MQTAPPPDTVQAEATTPAVDATVPFAFANVFAVLVFLAAGAVFLVPHAWLWDELPVPSMGFLFWPLVGLSLFVHEGLHGLGYRLGGARPGEVKYGIQWARLMPYAHCEIPLTARAYRLAGALPGLVLGVLPAVVGLCSGWGALTLFGVLELGLAGGDASLLWALRRVPGDARVIDHPTEVGCRILPPV
jgi:hypothetical protein